MSTDRHRSKTVPVPVQVSNHPPPWRTGWPVVHTIYDSFDNVVGIMQTAELAEAVCALMNAKLAEEYSK